MVKENYLRPSLSTSLSYLHSDSLAIDSVRTAKARRLRDQAWARYERRRSASMCVLAYYSAKWGGRRPALSYRITIDNLRRNGFWHRSLTQPHATRIYYEDLVHLEQQALILLTRLDQYQTL